MSQEKAVQKMKETLLLAGIKELGQYGIQGFSMRRVATNCGVSCAAPYKHFKDKDEFVYEITRYIEREWNAQQTKILSRFGIEYALYDEMDIKPYQEIKETLSALLGSTEKEKTDTAKKLLVDISMAYIRFLLNNPFFRSIIMQKDESRSEEQRRIHAGISKCTGMLVEIYCENAHLSKAVKAIKLYTVRSLIYGASLMLDNGEMPLNENTFERVKDVIEREFLLD